MPQRRPGAAAAHSQSQPWSPSILSAVSEVTTYMVDGVMVSSLILTAVAT